MPAGVGLVLGKFYPLTKGHQYLMETAHRQCRQLYIAVGSRPAETIPPAIRAAWIATLFPDAVVVVQPNTLPYFPEECSTADEFYQIWTEALQEVCGGRSPDILFTSEDYGAVMARYLGCEHRLVDRQRQRVPISATRVRQDPFGCWEYLDPVVRAYFVKTVCLYGPESTGKTELSKRLATHYQTVWQPEWAREYLGDRHCVYEDMGRIVEGHFGEHPRFKQQANKILLMDTDAITTLIFSEHYYDRCPQVVREWAEKMSACVSLYLLTEIDVPWVPDTSRDLGEPWQRQRMRKKYQAELDRRGLRYVIISGDWEERFQKAIAAIDSIILNRPSESCG